MVNGTMTCASWVGRRCNNGLRCWDNEVCDSVGLRAHEGGYCHCSPGHCWSVAKGGCVPEPIHAQEIVAHLMNQSMYEKEAIKTLETAKFLASVAISAKEGYANLNSIIGHVLAIGPGMLISAWTAKLIFAHSTIPAYFCYIFPWIYSPMAWGLYNVYYQIFPDLRLFCGLAILAFWPIIMAGISMMYGLHRQMKTARLMHVVNKLLVFYYVILCVGYFCLLWFAWSYRPEGADYINEKLRGEWSVQHYVGEMLEGSGNETATVEPEPQVQGSGGPYDSIILWLIDSFATFFFTCCAITDGFIVMISEEHNEAWLMHHQADTHRRAACAIDGEELADLSLEKAMQAYGSQVLQEQYDKGFRFTVEEEVIKDWLLLLHDVQVTVQRRGTVTSEAPAQLSQSIGESFDTNSTEARSFSSEQGKV